MLELSPKEVHQRIRDGKGPVLLDVREDWERHFAAIEGALAIPMNQVPDALGTLDPAKEIVVICHYGRRSQLVVRFLEQSGFAKVFNLTGGIEAWSRDVDPGVPCY